MKRLLPEEVLDLLLAVLLVGDVALLPPTGWSACLLPVDLDLDLTLLKPDHLTDLDLLLELDFLPGAELLMLPCGDVLDPLFIIRGPPCSGLLTIVLILTSVYWTRGSRISSCTSAALSSSMSLSSLSLH